MVNNQDLDKILKKLRKLQNLYEDGKNTEIYKPIAQSHRKNAESVQLLKSSIDKDLLALEFYNIIFQQ